MLMAQMRRDLGAHPEEEVLAIRYTGRLSGVVHLTDDDGEPKDVPIVCRGRGDDGGPINPHVTSGFGYVVCAYRLVENHDDGSRVYAVEVSGSSDESSPGVSGQFAFGPVRGTVHVPPMENHMSRQLNRSWDGAEATMTVSFGGTKVGTTTATQTDWLTLRAVRLPFANGE